MAVELFAGSGIVNYGLSFSWDVVTSVEFAVRVGQRQMSCADQNWSTGADCTRTTWGGGVRWIMLEREFSPFVGTAFSSTSAPLQIFDRRKRRRVPPGQRERPQPQRVGGPAACHRLRATEPGVPLRIPLLHGSEFERPATHAQRGPEGHLGRQSQPGSARHPFPGGRCVLGAHICCCCGGGRVAGRRRARAAGARPTRPGPARTAAGATLLPRAAGVPGPAADAARPASRSPSARTVRRRGCISASRPPRRPPPVRSVPPRSWRRRPVRAPRAACRSSPR